MIQSILGAIGLSPQTELIGVGLALAVWIASIVYCDRVAEDQDWNPWVARLIGALLPVAGPLYYRLRRTRSLARHGLTRSKNIR